MKKKLLTVLFAGGLLLSACGDDTETVEGDMADNDEIETVEDTETEVTEEPIEVSRPETLIKENYAFIEYDSLMRQPEEVYGQRINFLSVHIFQVMEDYEDGYNMYLGTVGSSSDIVALAISKDFVDTRIIEDDELEVYGAIAKPFVYETTTNTKKEVPLVFIDYYEIL